MKQKLTHMPAEGGLRHQRCEMTVVVVTIWMAVFGRGRVQKACVAGGQHGSIAAAAQQGQQSTVRP